MKSLPDRVGKRAPRKRHIVKMCVCGEQAFTHADRAPYVLMVSASDAWLIEQFWWNAIEAIDGASIRADSPTAGIYVGHRALHKCVAPDIAHTDHADRNGLNNMRGNLRHSDKRTNAQNAKKRTHSRWDYKGIRKDPRPLTRPWAARITVDGRPTHLGYFPTAEEAAMAYDTAARVHFGEYARLNFEIAP